MKVMIRLELIKGINRNSVNDIKKKINIFIYIYDYYTPMILKSTNECSKLTLLYK